MITKKIQQKGEALKKQHILSLLFLCAIHIPQTHAQTCANDESGHTFFSVRPEYQTPLPIKTTLMRNRAKARCERGGDRALQIVPFFGKSNKGDNLMKYFGPDAKTELVVDSNPPGTMQTGVDRDINPIHFGIHYTLNGQLDGPCGCYRSVLSFSPQRTVGGVGITYRQYFGRQPNACDKKWYWEASLPIMYVRNKINLEELRDCANQCGFPAPDSAFNMIEAFKGEQGFLGLNERMSFGLINDQSREGMAKTGGEVECILGHDYYNTQELLFNLYVGIAAPINRTPNGIYLFEAIPSYNQHFGFMFGSGMGALLWQDQNSMINWGMDINFRYYLKNTQIRSFDLKGRKWSRYMIVRTPGGTFSPGINLFTQQVRIIPRASFDINLGLIYNTRAGIEVELGYNFFARQAEKICLKNNFPTGYQTIGFNPQTCLPDPTLITLDSNIASNGCPMPAPGEPGSIPGSTITENDLNLLSAAHPAYQSNQIYMAVGALWNNVGQPVALGLGASYEFSGKNTALNRWLTWIKVGISI